MPVYTFRCKNCENIQSEFIRMSELKDTEVECRKCQSTDTERKLKETGFAISGPGVYKEGFSGYTNKTKKKNIYTGE